MKYTGTLIKLFAVMLCCGLTAFAQAPSDLKHFDKDGLIFDYNSGWTLTDNSTPNEQNLTLARADSNAQIRIYAHRGRVDTPERAEKARSKIVEPYLNSTTSSFEKMGAKPTRKPGETEIGGAKAEGVRIQAMLDEPGEAGVYWAVLEERLVVLTFFGPDSALKKATPDWDVIRNSLHIVGTKTAPKAAPK